MTLTLVAKRVRNVASSMAESPPPTTAISWPRKKNPSQVAHVESPWPRRRDSDSRPSIRAVAPVETMTVRLRNSRPSAHTPNGEDEKSTRSALAVRYSAPNRAAWARNFSISSGPMIPSGNPG